MGPSYDEACARFAWRESFAALGWTPDGDVNLADTIVGRHADSGRVALRWFGKAGDERTLSFDEIARLASHVAGFLTSAGVGKGDRVAGFLPTVPETLAIMLGT
jgi:acetyl-CoA synthetase